MNTQGTPGGSVTEALPGDDMLRDIIAKVAEMSDSTDPDDRNTQWIEGYSQACGDIVLMICRMAQKRRKATAPLMFS